MNIIRDHDISGLWLKVNNHILWAKPHQLDYVSSLDTMMGDCVAASSSCEYNLDLGRDLWLTPVRWTTLTRQYIDPERLTHFLDGCIRIGTRGRGINALDMNVVKTTTVAANARASRRKWGGCMRMMTYRAFPQPTLSLYSRTSYLGYIGGLDLMVAHVMAKEIGKWTGIKPSEINFRWHCEAWQFHGFKSMAFIFASGQKKYLGKAGDKLDDVYPTWKLVRSWYRRLRSQDVQGLTYGEMKYSAEKRIRRRMHAAVGVDVSRYTDDEHKAYQALSTPADKLDFSKVMMVYRPPPDDRRRAKKHAEAEFDDLMEEDEE